jgi:hypothetical protein
MRNIDQQKYPTTLRGEQLCHKEKVRIYIILTQEIARKVGGGKLLVMIPITIRLRPDLNYLKAKKQKYHLKDGRAMAQAVSHQPSTAEARVLQNM